MSGIVFVHGAGDSSAIWQHQLAHLGARTDVAAVDLAGHGTRIGEPATDGLASRVDDVLRALDRLGFDRPVVVGHGMGGAIALTLALDHASRIGAIVLVSTSAKLAVSQEHLDAARARLDSAPADEATGPPFALERTLSPDISPELRSWLQLTTGDATPRALLSDLEAWDGFDVESRLKQITTPAHVIGGRSDQVCPPPLQHYLAGHLPTARRTMVLSGAGYYVMAERAGRFNALLSEFLIELEAGEASPVRFDAPTRVMEERDGRAIDQLQRQRRDL